MFQKINDETKLMLFIKFIDITRKRINVHFVKTKFELTTKHK